MRYHAVPILSESMRMHPLRRRKFITLLAGAAVTPLAGPASGRDEESASPDQVPQRRLGATTMAENGLITLPSVHGVKESIDRLEADVKSKGMTVFARIDHAAGAQAAGLTLRPTELLIFGNAKAGTPLMQSHQTIGIDLPLKVLAWQDAAGKVWMSYNEPGWLAARHGDQLRGGEVAKQMVVALAGAVERAAGR